MASVQSICLTEYSGFCSRLTHSWSTFPQTSELRTVFLYRTEQGIAMECFIEKSEVEKTFFFVQTI